MGIQGLISLLKPIHKPVNIADFCGQTAGIDAYCWLHKGAYGCAMELVEGKKTRVYVDYVLRRVDMLRHHKVKPILVFDGGYLPSKSEQEDSRRRQRQENKAKGLALLRAGNRAQALECFQKSVDISPEMALEVIKACRGKGVQCIVAPYEADAQLCYLMKSGITQVTITEDSDLLVYGCQKVIFKMDAFGSGTLINLLDLPLIEKLKMHEFTQEKFRHMCILSGCDYLPSIKGMGLITANKLLRKFSSIPKLLQSLRIEGKMRVPGDYEERFDKAEKTFLYQLVFDPTTQNLVPLSSLPEGLQPGDLDFAGTVLPKEMAVAIAVGDMNPITGKLMVKLQSQSEMSSPREASPYSGARSAARPCLTPGPASSGVQQHATDRRKKYDVQKNLNGLLLHSEPSRTTMKPFKPPGKKRKFPDEEDAVNDDCLATQYTEVKPKQIVPQPKPRERGTSRAKFRNPFKMDSVELKTGISSRYFGISSSSASQLPDSCTIPGDEQACKTNITDGCVEDEKENIYQPQPDDQNLDGLSDTKKESLPICWSAKEERVTLPPRSTDIGTRGSKVTTNVVQSFRTIDLSRFVRAGVTTSTTELKNVSDEAIDKDDNSCGMPDRDDTMGYVSPPQCQKISTNQSIVSGPKGEVEQQGSSAVKKSSMMQRCIQGTSNSVQKTTQIAIRKTGSHASALTGRCRSLGISRRNKARQKRSGVPSPKVSTLLAHFQYEKKGPKLQSREDFNEP